MPETQRQSLASILLPIWKHIRDELVFLQDQALEEAPGQLVNPISRSVYPQNTGCAALVFATEYKVNGGTEWLRRAQLCLESLTKVGPYSGLAEPKWDRFGWHENKGSLFSTGTLVHALWSAQRLLGIQPSKEESRSLIRYLDTCRIAPGSFSHDSMKIGEKPVHVQNVTAIALYLLEETATCVLRSETDNSLLLERDAIIAQLIKGQRIDGFWPYGYPTTKDHFLFRFPVIWSFAKHLPAIRRFFLLPETSSILFGDAVHHCIVLYYLAKTAKLRRHTNIQWKHSVARGWDWIRGHLVEAESSALRFDFDWEPVPSGFRCANFRDTSTYFMIIAMLPLLHELEMVTTHEYEKLTSGLLAHVSDNLLQSEDYWSNNYPTTIKPYEGPDEILKYILPRVGEASAWKGALLAEFVLAQNDIQI